MRTERQARVQAILDGTDAHFGRRVAFAIQALILVSVIAIAVETLPDLSPGVYVALQALEIIVVSIFLVEYVLRIWAAPSRLGYVTSFYGIIDLLAILPSLILLAGYDLQFLRSLRILRVLLLFKLLRYFYAVERLGRAVKSVAGELIVFGAVAAVLLYLCASAVYMFERHAQPEAFASIFHSLWWAVVTFTTVGYGDVYPITSGGRIFTGLILLLALGVVAVPTGLLSSALSEDHALRRQEPAKRDDGDGPP